MVSLIELISGPKWRGKALARNFLYLRVNLIRPRHNLRQIAVQLAIVLFGKETLLSTGLWTPHTHFG